MRALLLLLGVAMILAGGYLLASGGFTTTGQETLFELGPVTATAETREVHQVPQWAAALLVVLGVGAVISGARAAR